MNSSFAASLWRHFPDRREGNVLSLTMGIVCFSDTLETLSRGKGIETLLQGRRINTSYQLTLETLSRAKGIETEHKKDINE